MQDEPIFATIEIYVPQDAIDRAAAKGISKEDAAKRFGDAIRMIVYERVMDEYQDEIINDILED
jgi:hypothetical protein